MREKAYAPVPHTIQITVAEINETLSEFTIHVRIGNGGLTSVPSASRYDMPSAILQCSRLRLCGITWPPAKFPGRSEIDTIMRNGKNSSAMNTSRPRWAHQMR